MFLWDEDNIRWMEEASEATGYYEELSRLILTYLKPSDRVCEIGCGLGHLACAIAPYVKHITAIDINEKAIEKVGEKVKNKGLVNVTPVSMDWTKWENVASVNEEPVVDVILFSYISAVRKDWDRLKSFGGRRIIGILSNGSSGTGLTGSLYTKDLERNERRDTIDNVLPFLVERGIPYELIECELEYGQPLKDKVDAENFVKRYYREEMVDLEGYLAHRLIPRKDGFYLPKIKKSGILVIDPMVRK